MKKKGPWKAIKTEVCYKDPWVKVTKDKVIRPDGNLGYYSLVHIKTGVHVLPIDKKGNVYLVKEYKYGTECFTIEAPGGGIDRGEMPLRAAKRELKEETGIKAKKWTILGIVHPISGVVKSPTHLYLAQDLSFGESSPESAEMLKIIKLPFLKAFDQAMSGKINEMTTIVLIARAKNYLKRVSAK
ncbi:NUDIX hydrolase [Patescibacteria group bacterium]|nr:NUDIX hydrolase [Patescibacteria group bacterium]